MPTPTLLDQYGNPIERAMPQPWFNVDKAALPDARHPSGDNPNRAGFFPQFINANTDPGKKPGSSINMKTLRELSIAYPVARACINYRKSQVAALDWEIVGKEGGKISDADVTKGKEFFSTEGGLGGPGMRLSKFLNAALEDILVLDALVLYREPTKGGGTYADRTLAPETIKILVDAKGWTPQPPAPAYRQYINGKLTGEWTTDEMRYEYMNARTSTPYGLAPLEGLLSAVETALRAELWNLDRFTSGNIPRGIYQLPVEWQPAQIKAWSEAWNAMTKGNPKRAEEMLFGPGGGQFIRFDETKDLEFERLMGWLAGECCAVFGLNMTAIGLSGQTYKYAQEGQREAARDTGLMPLCTFLKVLFDDIIAEDVGLPNAEFQWSELEEVDELLNAQVRSTYYGKVMTPNEVREQAGMEPMEGPWTDALFEMTATGPVPISKVDESLLPQPPQPPAPETQPAAPGTPQGEVATPAGGKIPPQAKNALEGNVAQKADIPRALMVDDLRKFKRKCLKALANGAGVPEFTTNAFPQEFLDDLRAALVSVEDSPETVRLVLTGAIEQLCEKELNGGNG